MTTDAPPLPALGRYGKILEFKFFACRVSKPWATAAE